MSRMMPAWKSQVSRTLMLVAVCGLVVSVAACGGRKEEEPAAEPEAPAVVTEAAPAVEEPVVEEAPVAPAVQPRERVAHEPSTAPVLALRPESAVVTVGFPAMQPLIDRGVAFAKRVSEDPDAISAEVERSIALFAEDLGVEDAETFADVALGVGLDPARPMALFLGGDRLLEAAAALEAEMEEQEALGEVDAEGLAALEDLNLAVESPDMAVLLPCIDCEKAEATLIQFASDLPDFDAGAVEETEIDGVTVKQFGDALTVFRTEDHIAVGTAPELVTGIIARMSDPVTTKYGTPVCPAFSADEIVALVQANKLAVLADTTQGLAGMLGAEGVGGALAFVADGVTAYGESDDPAVITLRMDDDEVELLMRLDTAEHPEIFAESGVPGPLMRTATLPEGSPVFLGLRLTPELKAQLNAGADGGFGLPGDAGAGLSQLADLLGDELVVAATGTGLLPIVPRLIVMLSVTDTDALEDLLGQFLAGVGAAFDTMDFNGVAIKSLAPNTVPLLTLHYAIVDDAIVISIMATDSSELMGIVEGLQDATPSGLFASLDPPMDPTAPKYAAMVVNARFTRELLRTGSSMAGDWRDTMLAASSFLQAMDEMRIVSGMDDNWFYQQVSMTLSPEAAMPAQAAAGY